MTHARRHLTRRDAEALLRSYANAASPPVEHLLERHVDAIVALGSSHAADAPLHRSGAPRSGRARVARRQLIALASAAALLAIPSMAFAGKLPAPIQRAAAKVAEQVGVELPAPTGDDDETENRSSTPHGADVREIASDRDGSATGRERGERVSEAARDNRGQRRRQEAADRRRTHNQAANGRRGNGGGQGQSSSSNRPAAARPARPAGGSTSTDRPGGGAGKPAPSGAPDAESSGSAGGGGGESGGNGGSRGGSAGSAS